MARETSLDLRSPACNFLDPKYYASSYRIKYITGSRLHFSIYFPATKSHKKSSYACIISRNPSKVAVREYNNPGNSTGQGLGRSPPPCLTLGQNFTETLALRNHISPAVPFGHIYHLLHVPNL